MGRSTTVRVVAAAAAAALAAAAVTLLTGAAAKRRPAASAVARVFDAQGERLGTVRFLPRRGSVEVVVRLKGAEPGYHGIHLHAVGECDPDAPDGPFTSAGGHLAEEGQDHGDHKGDLPSLLVRDNGAGHLAFRSDRFTVRELFDEDGTAFILHAGRDNYANIPDRYISTASGQPGPDESTLATGDAGARVGCGVVRRARR